MPTLIITMGSTGSGKSKLAETMIDLLKVKDPKFFLIDDYIEDDKSYKKKLKYSQRKKILLLN